MVTAPLLFLWGFCITPLSIDLSNRYRIVDHPGERKIHTSVTPRGAGIVLWLGFLLWCLFAVNEFPVVRFFGMGGTLVFLSGYWDDMKTLNPLVRLMIHVIAAGFSLFFLFLPVTHMLVCLLWITGMTNAYNLIDGANGLCLFMFISASCLAGFCGSASFFVPLVCLSAGVLYWNFPRAKTFIGDGGTTLLGYLFSSYFIYSLSSRLDSVGYVELPFLLLLTGGVPIIDTLFAIIRRLWNGKSPFSPDRGHVHHRLLDRGISPVLTVLILTFFQILIVGTGLFLFNRILS